MSKILEESYINMSSLTQSQASGVICDWKTYNFYYRNCEYSLPEDESVSITYEQTYIQFLFLLSGTSLATSFNNSTYQFSILPGYFIFFIHKRNELRTLNIPECKRQRVCVVNIPLDFFTHFIHIRRIKDVWMPILVDGRCIGPLPISTELFTCIWQINQLHAEDYTFRAALLDVKIQELVLISLSASNNSDLNNRNSEDKVNKKMQRIAQLIMQNPDRSYTLQELAKFINGSPTFIKENFKKIYGKSVFQFQTSYKMEKALELIKTNKMQIGEVSTTLGYKHSTHFTVAFKRYYGLLPKQLKN